MALRSFKAADADTLGALRIEKLVLRRVDAADELLDASHELLMQVFDPSVVDPKSVFVDAVTDRTGVFRDFSPQFFAGVFVHGGHEWLAGFISSDLMRMSESSSKIQLAIGNIATCSRLREIGMRGVGSALWRAAVQSATETTRRESLDLAYSTAEAEPASLPFWAKLGYLWPQGVKYFQPPLEFDEHGVPEYEEVPETLLIHPLGGSARAIDARELRDMITAIYWNWGVRPSIRALNDAALLRAKEYAMGRVLGKTFSSLPHTGPVPLIDVPSCRVH
jgi:hypothetical protein